MPKFFSTDRIASFARSASDYGFVKRTLHAKGHSGWDDRFSLRTSVSANGGAKENGVVVPTQVWRHPLLRRTLDAATARRIITRGGSVAHRKEMEKQDRLWRMRNAHSLGVGMGYSDSASQFLKRKRDFYGDGDSALLSPDRMRAASLGGAGVDGGAAAHFVSPRTKASFVLLGLSGTKRQRSSSAGGSSDLGGSSVGLNARLGGPSLGQTPRSSGGVSFAREATLRRTLQEERQRHAVAEQRLQLRIAELEMKCERLTSSMTPAVDLHEVSPSKTTPMEEAATEAATPAVTGAATPAAMPAATQTATPSAIQAATPAAMPAPAAATSAA